MNKNHLVLMSVLNIHKRPFIILLQIPYLATGSNLSWAKPAMVKPVAS